MFEAGARFENISMDGESERGRRGEERTREGEWERGGGERRGDERERKAEVLWCVVVFVGADVVVCCCV